jgi:3-mercaptopyruvate sulfurtransferase SseA
MADFESSGVNTRLYAGLDEVVAAQTSDDVQLLDVRSSAQFTGQVRVQSLPLL